VPQTPLYAYSTPAYHLVGFKGLLLRGGRERRGAEGIGGDGGEG